MTSIENNLKTEIERSVDQMRTLRDEIRVKLHLAKMDAREEWEKLEPKIEEVERVAYDFSEATRAAAADAVHRLSNLRSRLH